MLTTLRQAQCRLQHIGHIRKTHKITQIKETTVWLNSVSVFAATCLVPTAY